MAQPKLSDYGYDLTAALTSVVGLHAVVPDDAFTAETLGTSRAGNGVVIRDNGLILTVGYLILEAHEIWLHLNDGRVVPGHALAVDHETGFGLVQPFMPLDLPALPLGTSKDVKADERVVMGAAGGRRRSVAANVIARQEFAGSWEYVLDDALFTSPAHPHWGGTAMIGADGKLLGIGSLELERGTLRNIQYCNLVIPIDLLKPSLDDLVEFGRSSRPPRPWLGVYCEEEEGRIIIDQLAPHGPASLAHLQINDVIVAVAGKEMHDLGDFYRMLWALGPAGTEVPLTLSRDGMLIDVSVISGDRNAHLKMSVVH